MGAKLDQFNKKRGDIEKWHIADKDGVASYARWSLLHRETDAATDVINYLHEYRIYQNYTTVIANLCIVQICFWYENHNEEIKKTIEHVLKKEALLRIWGRGESGIESLKRLADIGGSWHTESASEFLRLFGAVIEDVAEIAGDTQAKTIDFRLGQPLGVYSDKTFKALYVAMQTMKSRFANWTGCKEYDFFKKGQMRTRVRATEVPIGERMRAIANDKGGKYGDLNKAKVQLSRTLQYGNVGTAIHRVDDLSLIGRIQNKYALPMGADISGTTSDIISIIDMLNDDSFFPGVKKALLDDVPLLLQKIGPILAMVKNRHHTFLECGLVFNMIGMKDDGTAIGDEEQTKGYQPCQYQSLIEMIPNSLKTSSAFFKNDSNDAYDDIGQLLKVYSHVPLKTKDAFNLPTAYELKGSHFGGAIGALKPAAWQETSVFTLDNTTFINEIKDWYTALKADATKKFDDSIAALPGHKKD